MEFEQDALDTAKLTSLDQLGTPDSLAQTIFERFSLGNQVLSMLNGGNSNTLSICTPKIRELMVSLRYTAMN